MGRGRDRDRGVHRIPRDDADARDADRGHRERSADGPRLRSLLQPGGGRLNHVLAFSRVGLFAILVGPVSRGERDLLLSDSSAAALSSTRT